MNTEAPTGPAADLDQHLDAAPTANTSPAGASPPRVQHLVHVICLPMQLKRKCADGGADQPVPSIDSAWATLTAPGSPWQRLPGAGTHPDHGGTPWGWADALTEPDRTQLARQAWQARAYFHPFVQRILWDTQRVRWLQRTDIRAVAVTLRGQPDQLVTLQVQRCLLALFQPDIACLLLELDYQASADTTQPGNLPLDLGTLQNLLDTVRRTYAPYVDTNQDGEPFGGHCPKTVHWLDAQGQPVGLKGTYTADDTADDTAAAQPQPWKPAWAAHWCDLLRPIHTRATPPDGKALGLRPFGDDRAQVMTYVAFDDVRALNPGQWVRLCFADAAGTDPLPYAQAFLHDFAAKHCYDRYWYTGPQGDTVADSRDSPSRVLNCGYALTYVGQFGTWTDEQGRTQPDFFCNASNGALATFRHIYVFMGLIAHMQRAALLAASHRLTHMVSRNGGDVTLPDRDEVRRFYDQFVEFTQTYWFDEVTPQEQGQQIFDQWQRHLRIRPLYDEVRQELRDLAEYTELQASNRLNDSVAKLGLASLVLSGLAVLSGLLGMNILTTNTTPLHIEGSWTSLLWGAGLSLWFALPFGIAALFAALALVGLLWSLLSQSWRKSPKSGVRLLSSYCFFRKKS